MITTDLGTVTAYAEAVAQGYTGTKEEFGKLLANYAKTAEKVAEDKVVAEQAMKSAKESANRASTSEQNAKDSENAAAEQAKNVSDNITELVNEKEEALQTISEKTTESVNAVKRQEETSTQNVTNHTDSGIQRLTQETAKSKNSLDESIVTANDTKSQVDVSVEAGKKLKADLDKSIADSGKAKTALDGSVTAANASKSTLDETVGQAKRLDTSLSGKIAEGTQLNKDITASGQKAVNDINSAGAAKLDAVNKAAEAIVADREQIAKNKTDITSLNEDLAQIENTVVGKNLLNPDTVTIGKRMYIDGSVHTQESDFYTDFIAVKPNQHIYASFLDPNGNFARSQIRHVCAYDASETVLPSKGQSDIGYDYLVPDGVAYIVVTFTENNNINHRQLEASDTGIRSFEEYFAPYIELKAQAQIDKNTSGVKRLNEEKANGKGISFSINESGGLRVTYDDGK